MVHEEPRQRRLRHRADRTSARSNGWRSSFAAAAGWRQRRHAASTLALLEKAGLAYVSVDEPQGFASSTPPVAAATSDLGYVRLHGRNAATWDKATRVASDRFNYLYTDEELSEWVPRVHALAEETATLHVLFNNNYQDVGVRNARQMAALLDVQIALPDEGLDDQQAQLFE